MDWMRTNNADVPGEWAMRTTLGHRTYTSGSGVPVELMVLLANTLGADAWCARPLAWGDACLRAVVSDLVRTV
jgi:hypothetical protein